MRIKPRLIYGLIACMCAGVNICGGQQRTTEGPITPDVDDQMAEQQYHVVLTADGWIAALESHGPTCAVMLH